MTFSHLPKSRAEARLAGINKFFDAKPCRRGHIAPRWVGGSCVNCAELAQKKYRAEKPERVKDSNAKQRAKPTHAGYMQQYNKEYKQRHKARILEARRTPEAKAREKDYHKRRGRQNQWVGFIRRTYGLTEAQHARLAAAQENRCAICKTTDPGSKLKRLPIDHCHATKKVRGLLCARCNKGLGHFQDSPELLIAAIAYLQSPPAYALLAIDLADLSTTREKGGASGDPVVRTPM